MMGRLTRRQVMRITACTAASYARIMGANSRARLGYIGDVRRDNGLLAAFDGCGGSFGAVSGIGGSLRLLENPGIDAIVINTPPPSRSGIVLDACRAGKHIYLAIPVAMPMQTVRYVKESGAITQCNLWMRSHPHWKAVAAFLGAGGIGQVTHVRFGASDADGLRELDVVRWCLGDPPALARVTIAGRVPGARAEVRQTLWRFEGPVAAIRRVEVPMPRNDAGIEFQGTAGKMKFYRCQWDASAARRDALAAHCREFLDAIRYGGRCRAPIETAALSEAALIDEEPPAWGSEAFR